MSFHSPLDKALKVSFSPLLLTVPFFCLLCSCSSILSDSSFLPSPFLSSATFDRARGSGIEGSFLAAGAVPDETGSGGKSKEEEEEGEPHGEAGKKDEFRLDEISITATRTERKDFNTPRALTVVTSEEIEEKSQPSIMDTLDDKVGIWVEKRTESASDPVMRGFSGANILALIDGCTLSTLWGEGAEGGDDMYGKVDSESVERIEVIRGPSSVLYGSNALGGVINFITKSSPIGYTRSGFAFGGRMKGAYGSASQYTMFRQEFYGATPNTKFFLGATHHHFGDTEGGRGVGTMHPTGGNDTNWDFKMQHRIAENHELELAIQDVDRNDLQRYYRPGQDNGNDREAVTLTWRGREISSLFTSLMVKGYVQNKLDVRKDFDNRRTGRSQVRTYSGDIQAVTLAGDDHRLTYGMHYEEDHGEDPDDEQFTWVYWDTDIQTKDAPDTVWNNFGAYMQDEWDFARKWTLIASLRHDSFHFNSNVDKYYEPPGTGYDPKNDDYSDNYGTFTGGIGLVYRLTEEINLVSNLTRGYRLFPPQFGLKETDFGWVAPHGFLDPVTSDTAEMGAKVLSERFAASCFTYYSSIRNWQALTPGSFEGQTTIEGRQVWVTTSGRANVYGVEIETESRLDLFHESLPEDWVFAAGLAWNYGQDFANDEPMLKTQPARALFALRWKDPDRVRKAWFEISADVVRRFTRIPSGDWENGVGYYQDPQDPASGKIRSTPYLPGYTVFDVRGGLDLAEDLSLTLAVENVTDKKYRKAHSRWTSEPGTNFLATLTYRF